MEFNIFNQNWVKLKIQLILLGVNIPELSLKKNPAILEENKKKMSVKQPKIADRQKTRKEKGQKKS